MLNHPIRPRERLVKYDQLRQDDLKIFHERFQLEENQCHRPCPACGEDVGEKSFEKDAFTFCRCENCNCLYVNPVPTEELLGTYYDGSESMEYFHREVLLPSLDTRRDIMRERVLRMKPFVNESDKILEIGSSIGIFVEAAQEQGWHPAAVEINTELVNHLKQEFDIPVYQGFFEQHQGLPQEQNVVVMWEVIEHLLDPERALAKAHSVLAENGRLIFTCPNVAGIEFLAIGPEHELIEAPGHLNYFSIDNVEHLLNRAGFEVEHYETPGILDFVDVMGAIPEDSESIGDRFLTTLAKSTSEADWAAIDNAITTAIQNSRLSGNMFVVARRMKHASIRKCA